MKPIINKSRLMKDAHRLRKYEGYDLSTALKLAWMTERKKAQSELEFIKWNTKDPNYIEPTKDELYNAMANWNHNYYNGYGYKGD